MVVWGGTPLFTKLAVNEMDPLVVGMLRTVIAGLVAAPILLFTRQPWPSDRKSRLVLAYSGFAAFIAFPLLFSYGQQSTSATHGALLLATLPVFTSVFGRLVERVSPSRLWLIGLALAFAGELALIVWRAPGSAGGSLAGDAIVLASSLVCSTGYVAGARLAQEGYRSLSTTLWGVAGAAAVLAPFTLGSMAMDGWPQASAVAWGSVLVLAVMTSIVGYIAWYWALAHGGISRIASIQFSQPLFGLALAALVLAERPAPMTAVAAAAILGGAWIVQRAD
jgi:drug/metabolite transporter (DMT)-like permease